MLLTKMRGHKPEFVWERKELECTIRLVKFAMPGRHTSMTPEVTGVESPSFLFFWCVFVCVPRVCVLTEVRAALSTTELYLLFLR